ncbi:hypothetical protein [Mastigocoleus testarum]|uniref:Uncharacterized protein n=1 Tax=Mastigocoleus testarum BC008 TaxID=371196 RepID=A0A0V7ZSV8_9CYAN|nr:hypothetical protein [Mastigocoleus testarum]KST67699.1 hypothetical protein BC008_43880 [Mastigocoleus testarum BC008]
MVKIKFDLDSANARADTDNQISELTAQSKQKQLEQRHSAQLEVAQHKQEWQTELDNAQIDYQQKAQQATQEQLNKIGGEKTKGETEAAKHLEDASRKAEAEKHKAERQTAEKKQQAQKESGGFFGWVKSAAKALIDGVKQAVNSIYENLRKVVKAIFEAAKKLANAAIDLARNAIIALIQSYGAILKALVKVAFLAFGAIAQKITAKIDQVINKAVQAVNAIADSLQKSISLVLDSLASFLDQIFGLLQSLYNGILTAIGMVINGEIKELLAKVKDLISAAQAAPPQFETAALEELLGGNLDQPLSNGELSQAAAMGIKVPNTEDGTNPQAGKADLPSPPWTTENVGVDSVENNMELSPELAAQLMEQTNGDGSVMLGQSNDQSRSMESIISEASQQQQDKDDKEQQQAQNLDDGLSPRQRADIKWQMMRQGIAKWWSQNWPLVIGGTTAAIGGFVGLNIITGGAITAALPAIMSVVAPLFDGMTVANIAANIRDYLVKGWAGDISGGGKSLAKGLAGGAIEIVSALTFKVGETALKGVRAAAKGAARVAKGGVKLAQKATQAVIKGAKYIIEQGKVLFKGISGSAVGKQFKRLQGLGQELLNRMRFKAFRIRVKNRKFRLEGRINPWVLLASGELEFIETKDLIRNQKGKPRLDEEVTTAAGIKGIVVGVNKDGSQVVRDLQRLQEVAKVQGWPSTDYNSLLKTFTEKDLNTLVKNIDNLPKTTDDWVKWASNNPIQAEGLNVAGVVEEYGKQYPQEVNRFLNEWFAGKYTRYLSNSKHVENLATHGIPEEVLQRIAQDPELNQLAVMMRPSNPAHATRTRQITLPKPGTASIVVPKGSSMKLKDLAKNTGPSVNRHGFYDVQINLNGSKQTFVFVDDRGSIKLELAEAAYQARLKAADNLNLLQNSKDIISLPEGDITTSISSQKTPPVSTSLGSKEKGLVGTSLYQGDQNVKYFAVSEDGGKTYRLEKESNILDEKHNILPEWEGKVVGSDIDLLAMLSPDGSINQIGDINHIARKKPELFNALIEAFAAERKNIPQLPDRQSLPPGSIYEFPTPASDIQHGAQIPYAFSNFLRDRDINPIKLTPDELQAQLRRVQQKMGAENFRKEVEKIINISDEKTVVTFKGKNYEIALRDAPMFYRLLGHPFPVEAYLPI